MTDYTKLRALCDAATDGEWTISWHTCRMDAEDVEYAKKEGNSNAKIGDVMWKQATSIGPISPDHCHWSGYNLGCSEEDAKFIAAANPQRVRALIDEVEKYRAALEEIANAETFEPVKWQEIAQQALKGTGHE